MILSYLGSSLWLASLVVAFSKVFNAAKEDPPLEPLEGAWLCQYLEFGLLASRTVREYISVFLNRPVCGRLLEQPLETHTKGRDCSDPRLLTVRDIGSESTVLLLEPAMQMPLPR